MELSLIVKFLSELKQNNNREWFQGNKPRYKQGVQLFEDFLNLVIPAIRKFDPGIGMLNPKECVFRIYRDVRFSKDKSPYKTNFGAFIAKGGRKGSYAGYYIHLEPGESFLGGGIYMPPAPALKAVRSEIYYNTTAYKEIINKKEFVKYFGEVLGSKLSRPPKDFSKEFEDIDLLKFKDYYVAHKLPDEVILNENLIDYIVPVFRAMLPFNHFINKAVDTSAN